nr:hypothetical protein BaRGS_009392 [Batillaria attramentaria]
MGGNLSCASGKACGCGADKKRDKKKTKHKRKRKKFADEIDAKRRGTDEIRNKASELLPKLSQHDAELVEERIRTTERKYGELQASAEKKRRSYGALGGDLGHIKQEADQYLQWLDSTSTSMSSELRLGFAPQEVEEQLQIAKELKVELEEKQVTLEAVQQKAEALIHDLPGPERSAVEHLVRQVQAQHSQLEEGRQLRLDFSTQVEKEREWLQNRVKAADKLDTVRLLASEVDKQADKSKGLAAKVNNRLSHLEQLQASGDQLKQGSTEEGADQVDSMLAELREQQSSLATRLKQQEEHLRNCAAARRLHEADCQKVEHWCKETDIKCSGDLPLDCATEVLEEQLKQYKALSNTAHVFESLVRETVERGEGFKPKLHEADLPILKQQLASLQDMFNSTSSLVNERTQLLETTIKSRQAVQGSVEATTRWLDDIQEQIKAAEMPVGASVEDAEQSLQRFEALEKALAEYQPTIAELNSNVEALRAEGQLSQVDAILQLTSQHEMLIDRVAGSRNNRHAAMAVRQQHQSHLAELLKSLEDSQNEMESIAGQGITVPERLEKYKALQEKLVLLKPEVSIAEDHAHQIAVDCSQEDRASVLAEVESAQQRLGDLLASVDMRIQQCQQLQHDRADFEAAMNSTVAWLEEKEEILASLRPLHLDSDKVDPVLEKHKTLSGEAMERLSNIKEKASVELAHFQELEEPVPEAFSEKLQQINALEQSIQEAIKKKEEYLQEAKADREQLETSMHQVSDWLRGAEDMLDSGYDGLDYDTIDQTLTEFSDEMDQVSELSEKLLTTLDTNDTETLHQSLASVSKRLTHVMASSQKKQQLLESKTAQWHNFQESMLEMGNTLDQLETEWAEMSAGTLTSPEDLDRQLQQVKVYTAKLEDHRPTVDNLNETARSLNRTANASNSAIINRLITSLNERWDNIITQAEGKQATLEELKEQWQDFSGSLHGAEDVISVNDELESVAPQIERLKTASVSLQKALPSAEAKVTLQERFLLLLENYERLHLSVQEQISQVQEELDDRDNFQTEVAQTLTWLTDTQDSLRTMDPDASDASENVEKCKIYQQEIAVRMEQMRRLTVLQETKYAALGRDVPEEMRQQLEEMHSLEKVVSLALREKEEELIHLHADREEYRATLSTVQAWLQRADQQLQERIISIPEARLKHQELLSEFEDFKQSLDKLRSKGGDIIRHSSEQDEKQEVQKTIADINRQWLSLQAQTADRTQELSEAADLAHAVEDVANSVQVWVTQAESVLSEELSWSDFDSVREQLKSHRRLTKDLDQNEDKLVALNAMVKQLDQVCDTTNTMAAVTALRHRVQHVSGEGQSRLSQLEDANRKIEDYEKEIADLTRWMEETRTHISMRDTTRDLKEQLSVQEVRYMASSF